MSFLILINHVAKATHRFNTAYYRTIEIKYYSLNYNNYYGCGKIATIKKQGDNPLLLSMPKLLN